MKHIDITRSVMRSIVTREERSIRQFRRSFMLILGGLFAIFVYIMTVVIRTLSDQQSFDLLTVFTEDREVIVEFWQDTVLSFLQELPQPETGIALVVLCITFIYFMMTRHKRQKVAREEQEIQKYSRRVRR